jgi:hypothetical protein
MTPRRKLLTTRQFIYSYPMLHSHLMFPAQYHRRLQPLLDVEKSGLISTIDVPRLCKREEQCLRRGRSTCRLAFPRFEAERSTVLIASYSDQLVDVPANSKHHSTVPILIATSVLNLTAKPFGMARNSLAHKVLLKDFLIYL